MTRMKTTVDQPDAVLQAAKDRARRDGTNLRALLVDGLRTAAGRRRRTGQPGATSLQLAAARNASPAPEAIVRPWPKQAAPNASPASL